MLRNYFLVTLRKLFHSKNYFLLSLIGLSVSIAAVLLIAMFIVNEMSYDRFHTKALRIVSINSKFSGKNETRLISRIPFPAKQILLNNYPEVQKVVRFYRDVQIQPLLQYGDTRYTEDDVVYTDPEFLDVFDFELIKGDKTNPFPSTNSIIVTDESALRYFGDDDPVGKTIRYQNNVDVIVTGVVKAPPRQSHIKFDFLMPVEFQRQRWKVAVNNFYDLEEDWNWHGAWTYVLLKEDNDMGPFAEKIEDIPHRYYPQDEQDGYEFQVVKLADVHMNKDATGNMSPSGSKQQLMMFIGISVLLLSMASINYTNLATAHFINRLKEAGLRQTLGARRGDIVIQFIGESIAVVCSSFLIGLAVAQFTQPFFSPLFNDGLNGDVLFDPWFLISCIAISTAIGIASALYPAIMISRQPAFRLFKGSIVRQSVSLLSLRSVLVMIQLGMSTLLILGVLLIREQLSFIQNKDLGYKKDNILTITNAITMSDYETFRNDVLNLPGVEQVYRGYFPGANISRHTFHVQGIPEPLPMFLRFIGPNFLETFDIPLVAGSSSIHDTHPDSSHYILVNEKGARDLGWTNEEAIGKKVSYTGGNDNKKVYDLEIIGVVKDANFESLYNPIQGSFFQFMDGGNVAICLDGKSLSSDIQNIDQIWKKRNSGSPMEYNFLSDNVEGQYKKEEKLSQAIIYFTSLAIVISCIGLVSLTSFIAQQRTKEIGIRKVHGATVKDISGMFISYFLKLSVVALLISIPLGYHFSNKWLQNFAYHTEPGVELVLKCVLISVALILVSVVSKVVHASRQNPVVSIRHE